VMAAEVSGSASVSDWCRALDTVQARHPLFSIRIARNKEGRPCFYQDHPASIPFRVVQETNATRRWELETQLELSIPFNPTSAPLVRAVLLHEEQQAAGCENVPARKGPPSTVHYRRLLPSLSGRSSPT
jgi:hypothetical protein